MASFVYKAGHGGAAPRRRQSCGSHIILRMRETQKAATLLVAGAALLLLTYQVLLRRVNSVKNQENQILLNSVTSSLSRPRTLRTEYKVWPAFSTKGKHSKEWYAENCFDGTDMKELEEVFLKWIPKWSKSAVPDCADLYHEFDQLYEVHHRYTPRLIFPPKHAERVRKWLRGDKELLEAVHHQTVLHVFQPLTGEHSLYNTVRTKRPRPLVPVNLHEWVDRQANDSLPTCDFCNFRNMTATDALGRHETSKTMRVSNTFKVERWHSLVVTRHQHHPLNFSLDTFVAFLDEANAYIKQIARTEEEYM